ncbi:DUF3667 domain-containing protein [Tunicatimonas pelagia]|uniref:DUF3667 domain-containing protein n=1 Tax=Tunicatimonas pelagia TaxID=931531 RepID=UPI002666A138|nr:DUF3667 domain-containing protein [Tunicatimonas pelagia]WKN46134.1 DUF3667 domain-containing protein [Tunicatimonas pelagia]
MKRSTVEQSTRTAPRITLHYLWQEILSTLSWDKGLFFTCKQLLINPGAAIREYIAGERKRYSNPIRFLVFATALASFVVIKLDLIGRALREDILASGDERAQQAQQEAIAFVYQYYNIIGFLTVPLLALITHAFFRRRGYNYAEHLTLAAFVTAEYTLLYLLATFGLYYYPALFNSMVQLVWFVYFTWAIVSFFPEKKWKAMGISVMINILYFLAIMLVAGVVGIAFKALSGTEG